MRARAIWLMMIFAAGCHSSASKSTKKAPLPAVVAQKQADIESRKKWLEDFIDQHVRRLQPLWKANNLAYWLAATTGAQDAYTVNAELELAIRQLYSSAEEFQALKKALAAPAEFSPLVRRQAELLLLRYQENQLPQELTRKMVELSTEIQRLFNTWRAELDGKQLSDSELIAILRTSPDSEKRRRAWEAYQQRGALIAEKLLELVRLRNQAARQLGFENYYQMQLLLMEQRPEEIKNIFDELARVTDVPFAALMQQLKADVSRRFAIRPEEIRPWHLDDPFFQEAPQVGNLDLDAFFAGKDPVQLVIRFFSGLGLEVEDVLQKSDLFPRAGKMPHAFCTDMDRKGDVRVLANFSPTEGQFSTLLHELGHAVYSKYLSRDLPWLLREEAHPFTTEAVAMLFGRLTRSAAWLTAAVGVPPAQIERLSPAIEKQLRTSQLVMARWTLVMVNFERALYENPEQDLNTLWWNLKERFQLLKAPARPQGAADWAAKIHITAWPVYYHNYMLGEMLASQLLYFLAARHNNTPQNLQFWENRQIGQYLIENIFIPGRSLRWDELIKKATGESLQPKYFADQFAK